MQQHDTVIDISQLKVARNISDALNYANHADDKDQEKPQVKEEETDETDEMDEMDEEDDDDPDKLLPSQEEMRKATLEGIAAGKLPEMYDIAILLPYVMNKLSDDNYDYKKVEAKIPWLKKWLVNPANRRLIDDEIERTIARKIARIVRRIHFLTGGCLCMCLCKKLLPCCMFLHPCGLLTDLLCCCMWITCCDWWLGKCLRRTVIFRLFHFKFWSRNKMQDLCFLPATMHDDEELGMYNMWSSNSYRVADIYALTLLLALALLLSGFSMTVSALVLLTHQAASLFLQMQFYTGIALLGIGSFLLSFFCRCTL